MLQKIFSFYIFIVIPARIFDTDLLLDFWISKTWALASCSANEVIYFSSFLITLSLPLDVNSTYEFRLFRELVDSKTIFGYYLSLYNFSEGALFYFVMFAVTIGFYIGLSIYVDAFSDDIKAIFGEMNREISSEKEKNSISRAHRIDSFSKLRKAISVHNEMSK